MKFKLLTESLKQGPYMMRNDGKVFLMPKLTDEQEEPYHPYYNTGFEGERLSIDDIIDDWTEGFSFRALTEWFRDNTNNSNTKKLTQTAIDEMDDYIESDTYDDVRETKLYNIFYRLDKDLNQEFLRFRVGGEYDTSSGQDKSIYFRISSIGYNWFNYIYYYVNDHKREISDVTIEGDWQSGNHQREVYEHKGVEFNHMPVDEFLTLSGNPVVEGIENNPILKNLSEGKSFSESYPANIERQKMMYNKLKKNQKLEM